MTRPPDSWRSRHCGVGAARSARAFSLVEVVLALALSGAVLALFCSAVLAAASAQRAAEQQVVESWKDRRFDALFEEDAASLLTWAPATAKLVTVGAAPQALCEMLCLVHIDDGQSPFPRRLPARVRYGLETAAESGTRRLVRSVQWLTRENEAPAGRIVADDLASAEVQAWHDDRWLSKWPPPEKPDAEPTALRLTWHSKLGAAPRSHTVLLPNFVDRPGAKARP